MDAYYINLDSAINRKKIIEKQIKESGLIFSLKRFPAIGGAEVTQIPPGLTVGQWGCWRSHMEIIESSLNNNQNLLIIEDDEYFNSMLNHAALIQDSLKNIEWDIIYLDLTVVETEDYLFLSRNLKDILTTKSPPKLVQLPNSFTAYGTHGYILNSFSKRKALDILKSNSQLGLPIDNIFGAAIQESKLKSFALLPLILMPGIETKNSQINSSSHPLENDWIQYREMLSIYHVESLIDNYLYQNEIEATTSKIINSRINFSVLNKFLPLRDPNKVLGATNDQS
jgi:GR25 family glycosyltransferase involved in LPS biosynthesis